LETGHRDQETEISQSDKVAIEVTRLTTVH
jgi:hypothetical protein